MTSSNSQKNKPLVLVADDNEDFISLITLMFGNAGAEVTTAKSGAEAITKYEDAIKAGKKIGLIALDVCMPPMSGNTASKKLRQLGYTGKIVAFTADTSLKGKKHSLDSGFDSYFGKTVITKDLIAALLAQYCQ